MSKRTYILFWTKDNHLPVQTKKLGTEKMRVWRRARFDQGWSVRTINGGEAYIATAPSGHKEAIILREYDSQTKKRVYPPAKKTYKPDPKPAAKPKTRRGRKPVAA